MSLLAEEPNFEAFYRWLKISLLIITLASWMSFFKGQLGYVSATAWHHQDSNSRGCGTVRCSNRGLPVGSILWVFVLFWPFSIILCLNKELFSFCKLLFGIMWRTHLGGWNSRIEASLGLYNMCLSHKRTKHSCHYLGGIFFSPIQFLCVKVKPSHNWEFCGNNTAYLNVINTDSLEG